MSAIVDLSVPTGPGPGEPMQPAIDYEDHERTAPLLAQIFGCEPADLPDGQGWASETVTLITHAGTHVDAPWHYFPTCDGRPARTIDELPLDWFLRPGVRLDLRDLERGAEIRPEDLERALATAASGCSGVISAPRSRWRTSSRTPGRTNQSSGSSSIVRACSPPELGK